MDPNMLDLEAPYLNRRRTSTTRQRPKVKDEDRKRIAMACDHCRSRKIKCTGNKPCRQCQVAKVTCVYPPNSAKIVVPEVYVETLQKHISALDKCLRETIPDQIAREELLNHHGLKLQPSKSNNLRIGSIPIPPRSTHGSNALGTSGSRSPATSHGEFDFDDETVDYEGYSNFFGNTTCSYFMKNLTEIFKDVISVTLPEIREETGTLGPSVSSHIQNLQYLSTLMQACDNLRLPVSITQPYTLPSKNIFLLHFEKFISYCGSDSAKNLNECGGIYYWFSPSDTLRDIDSFYNIWESSGNPLAGENRMVDSVLSTMNIIMALGSQSIASNHNWIAEQETEVGSVSSTINPFMKISETSSPTTQIYSQNHRERFNTYHSTSAAQNPPPGWVFFCRAKFLLMNPVEEATRPLMRLLGLMSFYLLSTSQKQIGYMYIGLAVRMAITLGLHHQGTSQSFDLPECVPDLTRSMEEVQQEREEKKREFWNIYILDRIYSCITGRPVMLSDEDIEIEHPSEQSVGSLPPGSGLAAHVRLCKIMGDIHSSLYRFKNSETRMRKDDLDLVQVAERMRTELDGWIKSLVPSLGLSTGVILSRSLYSLHLFHNQLYILVTRPTLLLVVRKGCTSEYLASADHQLGARVDDLAKTCINAARRSISLTRQFESTRQISAQNFADCTYPFNAVLVLLLSQLLLSPTSYGSSTFNDVNDDVDFGISYLSALQRGGNESAGVRANILSEFSAIVQKNLIARLQTTSPISLPPRSDPVVEVAGMTTVNNTGGGINCFHYPSFGEQEVSMFNSGQNERNNSGLYGQRTIVEMHSWLETSGPYLR